jgi:hypothetical protein
VEAVLQPRWLRGEGNHRLGWIIEIAAHARPEWFIASPQIPMKAKSSELNLINTQRKLIYTIPKVMQVTKNR